MGGAAAAAAGPLPRPAGGYPLPPKWARGEYVSPPALVQWYQEVCRTQDVRWIDSELKKILLSWHPDKQGGRPDDLPPEKAQLISAEINELRAILRPYLRPMQPPE